MAGGDGRGFEYIIVGEDRLDVRRVVRRLPKFD